MSGYLAVPTPTIRRSKSADHLATTPTLASKAQQLLGLRRLSIGNHEHIHDPRISFNDPWPVKLSISSPEDITYWPSSYLYDDIPPHTPCNLWEQESDTLPSSFCYTYGRNENVRHQASDAILASVYNRQDVPLAISQQTSASAMAHGFPRKASELLDIGGRPEQRYSTKKRPSRLDLSRLLPIPKSPSTSSLNQAFKGVPSLLEGILKPASAGAQYAEETSPSYVSGRTRASQKQLTKESLRTVRPEHVTDVEEREEPTQLRKGIRHTLVLSNLYEHYERTSFRDMMAAIDAMTESAPSPRLAAPSECTLVGHGDVSTAYWQPRRTEDLRYKANTSDVSTTLPCQYYDAPMNRPDVRHYDASVSSGHSQTSKASKTSDRSFKSFDPLVTSVLSLSDSEDGDSEPYTPPDSVFPVPASDEHAKVAADAQSRSTLRSMRSHWRQQIKQARTSSLESISPYLVLPEGQPLRINPRTSSRAKARHDPGRDNPRNRSYVSTGLATELTTSTSDDEAHIDGDLDDLQQATRNGDGQHCELQDSQPASLTTPATLQTSVPQLTSSDFSPATFEAYLAHMTNQVKAVQPMLGVSKVQTAVAERESPPTSSTNDHRVMTVTRQEEMLLAALRLKREIDISSGIQTVDEMSSQSLTQQKTFKGARYSKADSLCSATTADTRYTRHGNVIVYLDRTISILENSGMTEGSPPFCESFNLDENKRRSERSAAHSTAASSSRHGWGGHHSSWSRPSSMAKAAAGMLTSDYPEQARMMSARQIREEKALRDAYRKLTGLAMPPKAGSPAAAAPDEGSKLAGQGQGLS